MAKKSKSPIEDVKTDSTHSKLLQWVTDSEDSTVDSRKVSEKCRDYYDSNQWSAEAKKKLAAQKQAATVRNRIKPKIDGLLGMERSNRTTAKSLARTPVHEKAANVASEGIRYVLQDNFYQNTRSDAWENLLIEGSCGVEVIVEAKGGDPVIKVNHIQWDRLIYDPHSRRKDFSDAKYLGQVVWMDYSDAISLYPNAKDILDNMQDGSDTYEDKPRWMDNSRKRVKIVELYWHEGGQVKYACFTMGGYCVEPMVSPYKNEDGETEWPYEFGSLFVTRENDRYGAAFQLLDIQDEINKRGSKALHLLSVRQVRIEKGAVEDINKTRAELARPDGLIETIPGMEFEVLQTGDMANGQFELLAEAKNEIDAVSYNSAAAGKEQRNMSGVALRNRAAASQTELAPMFDVLKHLDIRVYRKIWNRIRQYWTAEKWIRLTDDEINLKYVGLNKPVTKGEMLLKQATEQGAPPEVLQQIQQQIQLDPMMKEVVSTENDIAGLDVDIIISDAPDSLTTQLEDFSTISEMVKSGFPMPPIAVIKASPISNKDEIIKLMSEQGGQVPPKVQQQMTQMQDQIKMMQQEGQKLQQENQMLKSGVQESQAKLQLSAQEIQAKLEARREEVQAEFQMKAEIQAQELELERAKLQANLELERESALSKIELERMKLEANVDNDLDSAINKVQNLIAQHEIKIQGMIQNQENENSASDMREDMQEGEVDNNSVMQMHENFMGAVQQIVEGLNQKKTINLIKKDGQLMGATVN